MAQALLMLAAVLAVLWGAVYAARRWRGGADQDQPPAGEMLTKFRELHGKGVLSDEEFRTIKTKLAGQLQSELRDADGTG